LQGLPLGRHWPFAKSVLKFDRLPTGWSVAVGPREREADFTLGAERESGFTVDHAAEP
jgi:hypothetical protein